MNTATAAVISAIRSAVAECVVDTLSTPHTLVVPAHSWHAAALAARDNGVLRCEWLSALDISEALRVVIFLRGASGVEFMMATDIEVAVLPSLTDIWSSCNWHERECAEMFGIDFTGHPDLRRLLLAGIDVQAPLRRTFPLIARIQAEWPGADSATPSDSGRPSQGRRAPALPPGVRAEWDELAVTDGGAS